MSKLVGEISDFQKVVQYKSIDNISWNFLTQMKDNYVSENDSIFTHEKSKATIALKNEQEITVASQSLIRIKTSDFIVIQNGNVEVELKANQPELTLQVGAEEYKLKATKNSSLSIKKSLNQSTFTVNSGEVDLLTQNASLNLKAGTSTKVKNKIVEVSEVSTELLYPKETVILNKAQNLNFKYKSSKAINKLYIQRGDQIFMILPNEKINLKSGHYKWGVIYKDNEKSKPAILQEFTLVKLLPTPEPIFPSKHSSIQTNDQKISFKWNSSYPVLLELLNEKREIVYSNLYKNTKRAELSLRNSGTYFWRLKIEDGLNQSKYSSENRFYLTQFKVNQKYNTIEIRKPNQLVNIEFDLPKNNAPSEFVLSKSKDFKNIIMQRKITSPNMSFKATTPGFYYWKILDKKGNIELKKILIVPTPPPKRAPKVKNIIKRIQVKKKTSFLKMIVNLLIPEAIAAPDETVKISWEKIKDAKEYEIEIVNNLKDKKIISKLTSKRDFLIWPPPEQKTYYYRVRYKDHWNRYSDFSPYASIIIDVIKTREPVKKIIVKTKSNSLKYDFGLFYVLSSFDFNQELNNSTSDVVISGLNSTGHGLNFKLYDVFPSSTNLLIQYQSRYGKVFSQEDFNQRQLQLALEKTMQSFTFSLGFDVMNMSLYRLTNNQIQLDEDSIKVALLAGFSYTHNVGEKMTVSPFFQFKKLSYQQIQLGLNYWYHWLNHISMQVSLAFEKTDLENNNLEIDSKSFQAISGLLYHF